MQITASSHLNHVATNFDEVPSDATSPHDAQEPSSATNNGWGSTSTNAVKKLLPDSAVSAHITLQLRPEAPLPADPPPTPAPPR